MRQQYVTKQAVLEVKVSLNCHFHFTLHNSFAKLSLSQYRGLFLMVLRAQFVLHQGLIKSTY